MSRIAWSFLLLAGSITAAQAQNTGVLGDWREPGGSVLRVFSCPDGLCMRVMVLRPREPLRFDIHDPDPTKHTEPICKLQIGYGFHPEGPNAAKDGRVYDPESGHTYHAEMHSEGDMLHLRGYILWPALGRTEKWKRVTNLVESCQ
ncbi:MAG: DUF2147 domain-containing protein [Janthinobacterium lividum]